MFRVLKLHKEYPRNAAQLSAKRGPNKPYKTALQMPGLNRKKKKKKKKKKLRVRTERNNCIHCHNIHDAENQHAHDTGTFSHDLLWRYPLPDNFGIHVDPKDGQKIQEVIEQSPAQMDGLRVNDTILEVDRQPIVSIADIQWVLHGLPNKNEAITITVDREGKIIQHDIQLKAGWKRTDISRRGSLWSLSPRLRMWAPEPKAQEREEAGLAENQKAMIVKWLNVNSPGGRAAKEAGIREGDVIIGLEGKPLTTTEARFHQYIKLNYKIGQSLPLTLQRDRREFRVNVPLVE